MSSGKGESSGNDHSSGNMESRVLFRVGEKFKSFKELESELKRFEMATSTKLWIRTLGLLRMPEKRLPGTFLMLLSTIRYLSDVYMVEENSRQEGKESASHRK